MLLPTPLIGAKIIQNSAKVIGAQKPSKLYTAQPPSILKVPKNYPSPNCDALLRLKNNSTKFLGVEIGGFQLKHNSLYCTLAHLNATKASKLVWDPIIKVNN